MRCASCRSKLFGFLFFVSLGGLTTLGCDGFSTIEETRSPPKKEENTTSPNTEPPRTGAPSPKRHSDILTIPPGKGGPPSPRLPKAVVSCHYIVDESTLAKIDVPKNSLRLLNGGELTYQLSWTENGQAEITGGLSSPLVTALATRGATYTPGAPLTLYAQSLAFYLAPDGTPVERPSPAPFDPADEKAGLTPDLNLQLSLAEHPPELGADGPTAMAKDSTELGGSGTNAANDGTYVLRVTLSFLNRLDSSVREITLSSSGTSHATPSAGPQGGCSFSTPL